MSISLVVNGQLFQYPELQDTGWAAAATGWASAVTTGMLQKAGGLFTLLADADFGPNFGLKSLYYKSRTSNPADSGIVRLAKTDTVEWRNNANSANLALTINGSDKLVFNGTVIGDVITLTGDVTGSSLSPVATTIANNAVTYAKFQQVASSSLVANPTGSTANAQNVSVGSTLAFVGTALRTTAFTGDVTTSANSFATTIANNAVTYAKFNQVGANSLVGNATGSTANATDIVALQISGNTARQVLVSNTSSAVNYLTLTGAITASNPAIAVAGSDSTIGLNYQTKAGPHTFLTGSSLKQLVVSHTASAVNFLTISASPTGDGPALTASGSDSNIPLVLLPKASGRIDLRNGFATTSLLVGGESVPNVNHLIVTGSSTGQQTAIVVDGTDTNPGLAIVSKGTGDIDFCCNQTSNDISFKVFGGAHPISHYVYARGGDSPQIGVSGTAADIPLNISSLGSGVITFNTANQTTKQAEIDHVASAVNYVILQGGATGNSPFVGGYGTDTDVSLTLGVKGAGTIIAPAINARTTASAANVNVDSGGNLKKSTSSLRYKQDVQDITSNQTAEILNLRPITYRSKESDDNINLRWFGFIAEEVVQVEPRLVSYIPDENDNPIPDGVQYERIVVLLTAKIKEQEARIATLEAKVNGTP